MSKTPLKIAYIIPRFHPFKGGAEKNIEALSTRLAAQNYEVTVLTTKVTFKDKKPSSLDTYKGIKIKRFWVPNEQLNLGFWPGLFPHLLFSKYDIIHVSGIGFIWTELCLIIKKIISSRINIILTPHGQFLAVKHNTGFRKYIKVIFDIWYGFLLPRLYNKVIAVVPNQKAWLKGIYKFTDSQIVVVPNGIDESYIEKKLIVHKPENKVVITYLNRMEWYKGIQDVIKACRVLIDKDITNFEFNIMGRPGGYTKELLRLTTKLQLKNWITFIFSPDDAKRDVIFYKESQINILPSQREATGIALIEAMAKGNAIITTLQNDAVDILINSKSGFAYNFGDVDRLAEILEKLITDHTLRNTIRKHNISFAKNFTWKKSFKDYLKLVKGM